eukprot:GILI01005944.1.p1 GENE.GILI01005944.1~~GILI01005944.1.p1  ORF type:complete len:401 (+),score=56.57 GILI01005944.1:29-1204(+)
MPSPPSSTSNAFNLFRQQHLLHLLNNFDLQTLPLDSFLRRYFLANKNIGSGDRNFISQTVFDVIRHKTLLDFISRKPTWEGRVNTFLSKPDLSKYINDASIPPHVRTSFPKELYNHFSQQFGAERTLELCKTMNTRAPVAIRANTLKISRDDLFKKLAAQYSVHRCKYSPDGIVFDGKISFFATDEYKDGLFEIQDEASQLVAREVECGPMDTVLDFCAGAGGKTLAFAPQMKNKGQIYVHDVRDGILVQAKRRLARAGIQNAQLVKGEKKQEALQRLEGKVDWLIADVPCSGTGTLRRNPDMKWRFSTSQMPGILETQRHIVTNVVRYLKRSGKLVYSTCSILEEENQKQVEFFVKELGLELVKEPFQTIPVRGSMDGFFAATFKRKETV